MPRRPLRPAHRLAALAVAGAPAVLRAQAADTARSAPAAGVVVGIVRAGDTGAPVADAQVDADGGADTRTRADGSFALRAPAGAAVLRVRRLGFRPLLAPAEVPPGDTLRVDLVLERAPVPLARMVVTPGQYGVLRDGPAVVQTLSRAQLAATPQVGEDLFRIVGRLPGVSASDFSAAFRVRGGAQEEVLVTLDGLELYEPFHLKDLDGALSIVDLGVVGGLDLSTGGFAARYGDRLTGVMEVRTLDPEPDGPHGEAALTLTTLRANARGTFDDGRGGWLASARRGFLEYALRLAGDERDVRPRYWDAFAKATWRPAPDHEIGLHVLQAEDRFRYDTDPVEPRIASRYGSGYAWLTWQAQVADRLGASTVLSVGALDWSRDAARTSDLDGGEDLRVRDRRDFSAVALRQAWTWERSPRLVVGWGAELERLRATYDYARTMREPRIVNGRVVLVPSATDTDLRPTGSALGAWTSVRARLAERVTAEAGMRVDRQVRASAGARVAEVQPAPRLALAWDADDRTTVRAAWGRYWQSQGVHELQAADGVRTVAPGELAEHRVAGVERRFASGVDVRVEAYERRTLRARPRWTSTDNTLTALPELGPDRQLLVPADGVARGVELLVRRERAIGLSWTAGYARARAVERVRQPDGSLRTIPRPLDQPHTLTLDAAWRPSDAWTFGAAFVAHTGWPTTSFVVRADTAGPYILYEREYEPRNASRLPTYHRLDMRVTRRFAVAGGRLALFVDVFNAYDRRDPRADPRGAQFTGGALREQFDSLLPRVPSFGVTYDF